MTLLVSLLSKAAVAAAIAARRGKSEATAPIRVRVVQSGGGVGWPISWI